MSFAVLIINHTVRLSSGWYGQLVIQRIWWTLHNRMFRYYLNQPYIYHIQHSPTVLLEKLQRRSNAAVAGVITPLFLMLSSFFSTLFMLSLLFLAKPVMTLILLFVIGSVYILSYQKIRKKLDLILKILEGVQF